MTEPTKNNVQLSTSQRVLLALKEAKLKIEAYERQKSEPIAIIGMGCRFPGGSDTPEQYWKFLRSGNSGIVEIPQDRWHVDSLYDSDPDAPGKIYVRRGGFLERADIFDPAFFRISPREAESLDPQHRLFLETAWESLEHAGIDPKTLSGSQTGVFAGIGQNDYSRLQLNSGDLSRITAYDGTGNLFCFVAGRLAFFLGLNGPNITLDTACSSSLVAIHLACQSLRSGECSMAMAGGVHLVFSPEITVFLCRTRVLSPDGLCRTFDADANGFSRGEGCGVVVLKRLSDALAQKDNILALIRGSAINHDGASSGLTVPNELAQEALIRQAIANARIDITQIGYIEAHGTGTSLGDPIELNALAGVFKSHPLYIGSVKTNFGHLEAAAGIAGLIKTVLALQHHEIPPHLHFKRPTPHFDWSRHAFQIPTQPVEWTANRIAGVSSFGMSGTNAHIILGESPITDSHLKTGKLTHRFEKERYWIPRKPANVSVSSSTKTEPFHPLLGKRLRLPFSQEIRFENFLRPDLPLFMNDHRIFEQVISPAASHLSTVFSAVESVFGKPSCVLEDVFFSRALALSEASERNVQLMLTPLNNESNLYEFRLISCEITGVVAENWGKDNELSDNAWILHAEGRVRTLAEHPLLKFQAEIHDIQQRCPKIISGVQFYRDLNNAGYQLGTPFQWGERFWIGQTEALCKITKPIFEDNTEDYQFYPGLADTCFQLLSNFWELKSSQLSGSNELYVPFSISKMQFYQKPAEHSLWCYAESADKRNSGNLWLFDTQGNIYAEVSGFEFRTANRQALFFVPPPQPGDGRTEWNNWLYQRTWIEKPLTFSRYPQQSTQWLIFADNGGVGNELASRLQALNHNPVLILPQDHLDIRQLINQQNWDGIVDLRHLDTGGDESAVLPPLIASLHLIQALVTSNHLKTPALWTVTRGVSAETLSNPFQAPVWGLIRTAQLEHPEIFFGSLDLPASDNNEIVRLLQELLIPDRENQMSWHNGLRHVARLQRFKIQSPKPMPISSENSYLITGGFGALGIRAAQWLADRGARYLALTGRRTPTDQVNHQLAEIERLGVKILRLQADIADKTEAENLFHQIQHELPELKGVIHAAGVIDDAVLLRQNEQRFKTVMKPKINGAWNLHVLTQNMNLDFFVCFSSMASILGSSGQANYGAANAFMDALAHYRRALGLAGTSIQWGAWSETGMAAELNEQHQKRLREQGMSVIPPDQGMSILDHLLSENLAEISVIPADWSIYSKHFPHSPLLSELAVKAQPASADVFIKRLAASPLSEHRALLVELVRNTVASVLKLKSEKIKLRERLFDAGMDSLMAVELRNRLSAELKTSLPATLVFDYPTIDAINDFLYQHVFGSESQAVSESQPDQNPDQPELNTLLEDISQKSDEDLLNELRGHK